MITTLIQYFNRISLSDPNGKWNDFLNQLQSMGCQDIDDVYNLSQQDKDLLKQWIQNNLSINDFDACIGTELLLGLTVNRTNGLEFATDIYCKKIGADIKGFVLMYDGTEMEISQAKQQFGFDFQLHVHDLDNNFFPVDGDGVVDVSSSNYTQPNEFFYAVWVSVPAVQGHLYTGQPQ